MTQAPQRLRSRSTGGSGGPGEAVPPGDPLLHPRSRAAPTPGSLRLIRTQDRAPARGIERREPEGEGGRSGRTSTAECGPERVQARGSLSARLSQHTWSRTTVAHGRPRAAAEVGKPPTPTSARSTARARVPGSNPRGTGTHGTQAGLSPRGTQAAPVRSRHTDTRAGVCVSSVCAMPSPWELRKKAHVDSDSSRNHANFPP